MYVYHELPPVYDEHSIVLILGSMPSPKSREVGFYYGHPQNRFWKVLSEIFEVDCVNMSVQEKRKFLYEQKLALWDVIYSCEIDGASDSSIKDVVPNDIEKLLKKTKISKIFTLGKTASSFYKKYCLAKTGINDICLPSTSPANCRVKFETLISEFMQIKDAVKQ
jgi:TDG/mug DNA glycosylase family protein